MKVRPVVSRVAAGAMLALALAVAGLAAPACGNPSEAGPTVPVDPAVLYGQMCARCHGADGRGDPEMMKTIPGIRDFSAPQFRAANPETIEQVIMTGKNQMPGFGASLSRPKIQHLAGYVRRLGEAAAAKPAPAGPAGPASPGGPASPDGKPR